MIHIDPATIFVLNKTCRLCLDCELLIVHRREIEPLMAEAFHQRDPEVVGNDYALLGTLQRSDWRAGDKGELCEADVAQRLTEFRKYLDFEIRGGWGPADRRGAFDNHGVGRVDPPRFAPGSDEVFLDEVFLPVPRLSRPVGALKAGPGPIAGPRAPAPRQPARQPRRQIR